MAKEPRQTALGSQNGGQERGLERQNVRGESYFSSGGKLSGRAEKIGDLQENFGWQEEVRYFLEDFI